MGRRSEFSGRIGLATCVVLGLVIAAIVPGVLATGPQPAAMVARAVAAELVSVNNLNDQAFVLNSDPSISGDGNVVAFSEFRPANGNSTNRGFVRVRSTNEINQIQPINPSAAVFNPVVSRDGCVIAYWARVFTAAGAPITTIETFNRCSGAKAEVANATTTQGHDPTNFPDDLAISRDGSFVAAIVGTQVNFVVRINTATGVGDRADAIARQGLTLVNGLDISDEGDVVAAEAGTPQGDRTRVSVVIWNPPSPTAIEVIAGPGGRDPDRGGPSLSADGQRLAFVLAPLNATGGLAGPTALFVRDRPAGVNHPIPTPPGVAAGNFSEPEMLLDGTQVAFGHNPSAALGFLGTDNTPTQVFVARSTAGVFDAVATELISFGVNDQPVPTGGDNPALSASGRFVAFASSDRVELGVPPPLSRRDIWIRVRAGSLTMTPTLNFGVVAVGGNSLANTVVRNASNINIQVAVGPPAAPFSIAADGCNGVVLLPGQTCAMTIRFAPTAPVSSAGQVTVSGEGASAATQLSGTGTTNPEETTPTTPPPPIGTNPTIPPTTPTTLPPGRLTIAPATIEFGTVVAGTTTETQVLTVTNAGGTPVSITNGAFSGPGADQFQFDFVGCGGRTLAANATCTVEVAAAPTRAGAITATFTIRGSGNTSASATLNVGGLFTPTLLLRPGVLRPGDVGTLSGQGFPPNTAVQIAFAGEAPFVEVTSDASGAFSTALLVLVNGRRIGGQVLVAVDQPDVFTGVRATFLVELATMSPSGSGSAATIAGVRSLLYRNG